MAKNVGRSIVKGTIVYIAVVLLSAAAIWIMSSDARRKIDALAVANADSTQWSLAQSEVEYLALTNTIRAADDDEVAIGEVRKRFDVFYSRLQTIKASPSFEEVRQIPSIASAISKAESILNDAVPLIDGDDAALAAGLPKLRRDLESIQGDLRSLSLAGVQVFASRSETQRNAVASALSDLGWIAFVLLTTLLGVVGALLANMRASQRQTSEIALTQSRLQAIISTSLDGILVVGKDGRVLDYNGAAEGIFGYARDEAIGEDMAQLIVPDHLRDAHNDGMSRYRETNVKHVVGSGLLQLEAKRKDGSVFPVELSINSAESEEGEIFVSYLRDISQRVENEKELVEARDSALAGEKAKADLLAVMSHEMRTPLNGVLGTLQLLSNTELDQNQSQYVGVMETSGKLLLEHVNNVLDISRADAGMIDIMRQKFDLRALVTEVAGGLGGQAKARGNELKVNFLSQVAGHVVGDEARVRQVLFNLIGNAIKFTQNGTVTIEVESQTEEDQIEFRVIDTGIGIADEDVDRIFDDFVTLDSSYQREVEGTGLGLGIVKRLVVMLGGEIGVESVKDEGSVFWFTLPLPDASSRVVTAKPDQVSQFIDFAGAKVLVVEDNEINRMIVREMLVHHGCEVQEAADGHEGVLIAENIKFDLIFMDISMPKVDGVEATRSIKAGGGPNQETPIVALTAHTLEDDVSKFMDAGMVDVVTKPLSADRLNQVLNYILGVTDNPNTPEVEMMELFGAEKVEELRAQANDQLKSGLDELHSLVSIDADPKMISALAHKLAGTAAIFGLESILGDLRAIEDIERSDSREELLRRIQDAASKLDANS